MSKRKKQKEGKGWFNFLKRKKTATPQATRSRKKKNTPLVPKWLWVMLTIIGFAILIAGLMAGFMYMEQYVKTLPQRQSHARPLNLKEPPPWLGEAWINHILEVTDSSLFLLDEGAGRAISEKLSRIPWIYDVQVKTTQTTLDIFAQYRRPIVAVTVNGKRYYVDEQRVVFEALPVTLIAVPEVVGFSDRTIGASGKVWLAEDIKAAVDLIRVLGLMDLPTDANPNPKPLLDEIANIDVSNFAGRKSSSRPHLILNVKDGVTQIYWGAAWGQASRLLEADEKEKVTRLYQQYHEYGNTLMGKAKFIELRQPQSLVPRP